MIRIDPSWNFKGGRHGSTTLYLFAFPCCSFGICTYTIQTGSGRDLDSLSDDDLKAVVIRMERTHCYGSCPAYALTIHGDGRVEYVSKENKEAAPPKQAAIAPGALKALVAEFAHAKFFSLPDYLLEKCTCRRCTDLPSAITELVVVRTPNQA